MAILRLVFGTMTLSSAPLLPSSISIDTSVGDSGSTSVVDRTFCCLLHLAADDADFMSHLLLGFWSSSIGVSLNSCDAGAAACDDHAARVPLLPLSFFWTILFISSADDSFLTSLLRSNLSVPCGMALGHSSILTLQRSVWAC